MIMISDDTLLFTISVAVDICADNFVDVEVDLEFGPQCLKGAGTFHSAGQSKEGSVGFGTSQHPIFMKLLPDHLWH